MNFPEAGGTLLGKGEKNPFFKERLTFEWKGESDWQYVSLKNL